MLSLNIPTFVFAIINLLVIYYILKRVLFIPVTNFIEKRNKGISDALDQAAKRERLAEMKLKEYEEQLRHAEQVSKEMYAKAIEKSRIEHANIMDDAKREADRIKKDGYREIEKEKEALTRDIKAQVTRLSIMIATKLLKENMNTERNQKLVEEFLAGEEVA